MSDRKFIPRADLDRLSKDELQQYYLDACAYFQVPPELNVLYFELADFGDGARIKVLAAKKGATDIIRDRLHISVVELTDKIVNGSIVFLAKGMNGKGRTEMASGSKYIEGLKGQELDSAIMTAQTRAIKRMTLQFAGGGLLDESEVPKSVTVDITKVMTRNEAPQPTMKPNAAVGQDNTLPVPTPAQVEAARALGTVKPEILAVAAGEHSSAQNPSDKGVSLQETSKPQRRSRQKPIEMDTPFSLDGSVSTQVEIAKPIENLVPAPPVLERLDEPKAAPSVPTQEQKVIHNVPVDAALKEYRNRLFKYTNEILPIQGKMMPSPNVGGPAMKVRLLAQARYGAVLTQLTFDQWEDMFKLFESMQPIDLVKYINDTIGAKE